MDVESLRRELEAYDQQQLLAFWDDLTDDEKKQLYDDIRSIDLARVTKIFKQSVSPSTDQTIDDDLLQPLPDDVHEGVSRCDPSLLLTYREKGELLSVTSDS